VLSPFVVGSVPIRSPLGASVNVKVIGIPFTSSQVLASVYQRATDWAVDLVRAGVELAVQEECAVLGFGGYTSIVTNNCVGVPEDRIACTSGNSLTVAAAVEVIMEHAEQIGAGRRTLAVVGAFGNIGATVAELASEFVDEVVLVGRASTANRLSRLASRLSCPTTVADDLDAVRRCNLIVSASNSVEPIILPKHIGDHPTVICDLAVPQDVHGSVAIQRPRARVLQGGVVSLPLEQELGIRGASPMPGHVYACFAETVLLGFEGIAEHYSYGSLDAGRVRRVWDLARKHRFRFASKQSN
jgi:predicted amino acid dehydrogenase